MSKAQQLLELARKRQAARWPGYGNLADYHDGLYECDHASPYTKSAGNVEADILVLLQDWSSHDRLSGPPDHEVARLGYTPGLPTNINLAQLLRQHFQVAFGDVFITNLFPFIKTGNLSRGIPARDMRRAAVEFGLPQIEIIKPKLVICLGTATFNAIRHACDQPEVKTLEQAIQAPFTLRGSQVWCQSHPGIPAVPPAATARIQVIGKGGDQVGQGLAGGVPHRPGIKQTRVLALLFDDEFLCPFLGHLLVGHP